MKAGVEKTAKVREKAGVKAEGKITGKAAGGMSGKGGGEDTSKPAGKSAKKPGKKLTKKQGDKTFVKPELKSASQSGESKVTKGRDRNGSKAGRKEEAKAGIEMGNRGGKSPAGKPSVRKPAARNKSMCPVFKECGGCQYLDMPYEEQLKIKQKEMQKLLGKFGKLDPIMGMKHPYHYRNKVHAVFGHRKGEPISGVYQAGTHRVVPVESCLIEDQKADEIIGTIRGLIKSFKIRTYDEDSGYGLMRHVLIKRGFATNEIMVVLVTASPIFPSKNNIVKALRDKHPEITTIIQNINGRGTSMVLGDREQVLYGKGFITDVLCGHKFRISSKSFYQINPVQTERLYEKALQYAGLTGKETVVDAYCGTGTIGILAAAKAKHVIGVELNQDAVKDAIANAKINEVKNIRFFCKDAGVFLKEMAAAGEHVDVVLLDPPRSGSTKEFMDSVFVMQSRKVVYVSCGPESLARDLEYFKKNGYEVKGISLVDLFPQTVHVECVVEIRRVEK